MPSISCVPCSGGEATQSVLASDLVSGGTTVGLGKSNLSFPQSLTDFPGARVVDVTLNFLEYKQPLTISRGHKVKLC